MEIIGFQACSREEFDDFFPTREGLWAHRFIPGDVVERGLDVLEWDV